MTPLFTDADVEEVARAMKAVLDSFEDPVHFYIEGEARRKWNKANPDGFWWDTEESKDELVDYKIIARSALSIAAPRIVGNVLRDMMEPSARIAAAGQAAIDAERRHLPLGFHSSEPCFRAMLTAYARERGVELK